MANQTLTRLLFPILLLAGARTSATATEGKRVVPQALDQRRAALQVGRVMFDQRQLDRLGQRARQRGLRRAARNHGRTLWVDSNGRRLLITAVAIIDQQPNTTTWRFANGNRREIVRTRDAELGLIEHETIDTPAAIEVLQTIHTFAIDRHGRRGELLRYSERRQHGGQTQRRVLSFAAGKLDNVELYEANETRLTQLDDRARIIERWHQDPVGGWRRRNEQASSGALRNPFAP